MDCVFCQIIRREAPAEIIYESDQVLSILDVRPIHYGHALVLPKKHCQDLLSTPEETLSELMKGAQVVAQALVSTLGIEGFNVFANNGVVAGQSVFHFHIHVTPRYAGDNIRFVLQLKEYPKGEFKDMARRLRQQIATPARTLH